jgi:hypothetical protein
MFKMFPVVSTEFWQQAVYRPLSKIDIVISTWKWAALNNISCIGGFILTDHYRKLSRLRIKNSVWILERNNCFQQTAFSLPDTNIVTASNHVAKSCLISRSAYNSVRHHLVPLIPWTPCYYKVFMNRGYLKCKI